ncbi:hypothetical protein BH10CYA1_BH10CYA1_18300 [soil metagenome]
MTIQPFFQIGNDASERQISEQNGATHVDAAQTEVDLMRLASGKFSTNTLDKSKTADKLPTTDLSGDAFNFSPALTDLRDKLKELVTAHPTDNPDTQNYCRTGANGELYARDKNSEQLITSDSPKSTFLERTLEGIKGFTDQFQFTTSKDKKLSIKTTQADVTVQKTEQGALHVTIDDKNGFRNLIVHTEEELKKILPQLNALLRTPQKTSPSTLSASDKTAESSNPDAQIAKADPLAIDFKTGIATITGGDNKNIEYNFQTGDLGVGGFDLGHFVFQQDGSTIMSNGDMIDAHGALTTYAEILAKSTPSELSAIASQAQSNAPGLAAGILAKAGSESISQGEIVALLSLDSALAAVESSLSATSPVLSQARSAIAQALGAALASQKNMPPKESTSVITFNSPYQQTSRVEQNSIPQHFH